ncbi:carboxymuconolactone decarboxylase family protein [Denitratisoma sp. DHT3]|uniref:carboxymuconolactone decarboxylase family protein n=1 Tax=Denitratisoma sp. DHT3 TaxID=1981880 RepID=UPI00119E1425|nr:carboxymuconolactone decarboxylase family protein [Denitratisoma sp. DHT3]
MSKPRVTPPAGKTGHMLRDSAMGLVPAIADAYIRLFDRIWHNEAISPSLVEMLRLRNARIVDCVLCRSVRYDMARADGLSEEKVDQINDDYAHSSLSQREKLALAFANSYLKQAGAVDPATVAALKAEFSPAELAQMAIALMTCHAGSRYAIGLGGLPETMPLMEMRVDRVLLGS